MATEDYQCACGVQVTTEMTENHLQICPLAVLECKFSSVGCEEKVHRKDQDEHDFLGTQKHLQLVASAAVSGCQQLYGITCEQGKLISDLDVRERKLEVSLLERMKQMENKISVLEHQIVKYQQEKELMMDQIQQLSGKAALEKTQLDQLHTKLTNTTGLSFVIKNFMMQWGSSDWKSPAMYTYKNGYKFHVEIDMSKSFHNGEKGMDIDFVRDSGVYDKMLKLPVRLDFTYDLYSESGECLYSNTCSADWKEYFLLSTRCCPIYCSEDAIPLNKLTPFIQDNLHFIISNIKTH